MSVLDADGWNENLRKEREGEAANGPVHGTTHLPFG
jgi:hypothetical protein